MLHLIHGDNQVASRQKLTELIQATKAHNQRIETLGAESLDRATLEAALLAENLFGEDKLLIIEGVFSLPKSKKKDELIDLITSASIDVALWEKKSISKTDQKKLSPQSTITEYKISQKLWQFLDQLSPSTTSKTTLLKNLHESVEQESAEFVFVMMIRQIRLLIQVKEKDPTLKLAPFMQGKLERQAKSFTLQQLLAIHHQLYLLDQQHKQSASPLSFAAELDLLVINL